MDMRISGTVASLGKITLADLQKLFISSSTRRPTLTIGLAWAAIRPISWRA